MVFALVPLLVLLGLAEGLGRLFPHRDATETFGGAVEPDPELIWRLRPRATGSFGTNELGFRDTPYRPDADVKVLLLGDSVSWGHGVRDYGLCYPWRLEQALQRRCAPRTVEVINAAVPGYSTFQQAALLRTRGLGLAPDLIVLQFCLNDVTERYTRLAAYGGDNVFMGIDTRHTLEGLYGWLVRHSRAFERIVRAGQGIARDREEYRVEKLASDALSEELEAAWEVALGELDGIRRLAAEHHIPLLLAIAPYSFQLGDPLRLRQPQDRLLAWAKEHGVPAVDLLPAFAATGEGYRLFIDPSHFSPPGHAAAADALTEPILRLLGE